MAARQERCFDRRIGGIRTRRTANSLEGKRQESELQNYGKLCVIQVMSGSGGIGLFGLAPVHAAGSARAVNQKKTDIAGSRRCLND
jgi:hypothetical protein